MLEQKGTLEAVFGSLDQYKVSDKEFSIPSCTDEILLKELVLALDIPHGATLRVPDKETKKYLERATAAIEYDDLFIEVHIEEESN